MKALKSRKRYDTEKEPAVATVVHARWVPKENIDAVRCSNCLRLFLGGAHAIATFIYCPACGAKMDGENNDN